MIDEDLKRLIARDSSVALDKLERDLWQRASVRRISRQTSRVLASWQAAVVAVAIFGSAAVGMTAAANLQSANKPRLLDSGEDIAPSTLLFGKHP